MLFALNDENPGQYRGGPPLSLQSPTLAVACTVDAAHDGGRTEPLTTPRGVGLRTERDCMITVISLLAAIGILVIYDQDYQTRE